MSSGFVCDRCGRAIFPKENTTFTLELHGPNDSVVNDGSDLCISCASAVVDIIEHRIVTKQTNMDAWVIAGEAVAASGSDVPHVKKAKTDAAE